MSLGQILFLIKVCCNLPSISGDQESDPFWDVAHKFKILGLALVKLFVSCRALSSKNFFFASIFFAQKKEFFCSLPSHNGNTHHNSQHPCQECWAAYLWPMAMPDLSEIVHYNISDEVTQNSNYIFSNFMRLTVFQTTFSNHVVFPSSDFSELIHRIQRSTFEWRTCSCFTFKWSFSCQQSVEEDFQFQILLQSTFCILWP